MPIYKGHSRLSKCMKALGYKSNPGGICYGYVHMGVQALLLNDINSFDNRIRLIFDNEENLAEVIQTHKEQWNSSKKKLAAEDKLPASQKTLTKARRKIIEEQMEEDRKYMDIPAFFEGIELYFQPREYPDFFGPEEKNLSQNAMLTAPFVVPQAIEQKSGMDKADKFTGFYNKTELTKYFQHLDKLFNKLNPPSLFKDPKKPLHPVSFVLNSLNHTISIGCDGENWFLVDPNKIPTLVFPKEETENFVDEVMQSFTVDKSNQNIALETEIWVNKKDTPKIKPHINTMHNDPEWQSLHKLTEARVNRTDTNHATLMQVAAQMGDINKVKSLLELNANPNVALSGNSALQLAAQNGHMDIVNLLLEQPSLEKYQYLKALHMAALYDHIDIVYRLLEIGAKAEQPDAQGRTVLFFAAVYGHNKLIKRLLENKNIDINEATNDGSTPLMEACKKGYDNALQTLLDAKAKPDLFDNYHMSALMYAAKNGHLSTVNLLLKAGVDPRAKAHFNDSSAVMFSITHGHLEVMKSLLEAEGIGKNIPLKNKDLFTYLSESTSKNHYHMTEALLKYVDDNGYKSAFNYAIKENNEKLIKVLYPRVRNIFVAPDGQTPLHIAAIHGSTRVVNTLLEIDPELINKEDANQQTAFDIARDNCRPAVIATLAYHTNPVNTLKRVASEVKNVVTTPQSFFNSLTTSSETDKLSTANKAPEPNEKKSFKKM